MPQSDKEKTKTHIPSPDDELSLGDQVAEAGKNALAAVFSSAGITVVFGVLTFILLSAVLSFDYLAVERTVEKGISKRDFFAPQTIEVVDEHETEYRRSEAQRRVDATPVYKPVGEYNQNIQNSLNKLFTDLNRIRKGEPKNPPQSGQKPKPMTLEEKQAAFNDMPLLSDAPKAGAVFDYLIQRNISDEEWYKIKSSTEYTVIDRILERGLTREEYIEKLDAITKESMPGNLSPKQAEVVRILSNSVLVPTRRVDEQRMDQLRKEAADKVEPVIRTYRKGEKIVGKGELVTPIAEKALEKIGKSVKGINWRACLGVALLSALFTVTVWSHLYLHDDRRFFRPSFGLLLFTMTILTAAAFILTLRLTTQGEAVPLSSYVFPLAAYALTISIFTHPRLGALATIMLSLLMALTLKPSFSMMSVLLLGSLMGIFILNRKLNFTDRGQLMWAGVYVSLIQVALILSIFMINSATADWGAMVVDIGWGAMGGVFSAIITIGIMPLLESSFRLVSPYTLLELASHDKPLLKRMQQEAPGTFYHSLMVASLSEAAAEAIGANALLTRVGSLYHDIGKMKRPLFFIENQAHFGAENPHDKLTPRLSKMVITAHPRDSLEMARQHHLPESLMDFMTEHHGTLTAGYFYNQACIQEGKENVNKSQFRYAGPKPRSRETAIVMMADACESAVRALKSPTVAQIEERIDKIVQARIDDGQFDNCPITFKDINIIKETFVRVLRGIQHNRIEYQQTVMKELGKKLPEPGIPNLGELQQASKLKVVGGFEAGENLRPDQARKEDMKDD